VPSLGGHYLQPDDIPPMQAAIDEAAEAAGREPSEIKRIVNVMALFLNCDLAVLSGWRASRAGAPARRSPTFCVHD